MKKAIPHIVYFLLFAVHLYSIVEDLSTVRMVTKPLICISLIAYLWISTGLKSVFQKLIAAGLFFGWLGDIFLMLPNKFLFGLAAFLIGHILYVIAFIRQTSPFALTRDKLYILVAGFLAVYSYYFYTILAPSLGVEKYPVIAYIIVIALMGLFSYTRKHHTNTSSFLLIFLGALLFIVSDSILAANKFVAYIANSGLMIMCTYMLAQYAITLGAVVDNQEARRNPLN
ncbi:MAG: lysoplasmalogenase [Sphingobacterium hotanense]